MTQTPPARPFNHEGNCQTPDAGTPWIDQGDGSFMRVCSCTSEYWYRPPVPKPKALQITPERHRHEPGCDATAKVITLGLERFTKCFSCDTSTHFLDLSHMDEKQRREYRKGLVI